MICSTSCWDSETQEGPIITCCRLILISTWSSLSKSRCGEGQGQGLWGMDRGVKELEVSDFLGAEAGMISTVSGCSGRGVLKDWRTRQTLEGCHENWRTRESASTCTRSLLRINPGLRWPFAFHMCNTICSKGEKWWKMHINSFQQTLI